VLENQFTMNYTRFSGVSRAANIGCTQYNKLSNITNIFLVNLVET